MNWGVIAYGVVLFSLLLLIIKKAYTNGRKK